MHVKRFNKTILNVPIRKEQLLRNLILKKHYFFNDFLLLYVCQSLKMFQRKFKNAFFINVSQLCLE